MELWASTNESVQANRAISTGKLHTLLCFHTRPINVVVFHGSQGRTRLEVGFPLRCIQLLSVERWPFHEGPPDHYDRLSSLLDLSVSQSGRLMPLHSTSDFRPL